MEQNMETLSSVNAPGDASFNAADRLAIINLFGAYAQSYDAGKTDEFLSVFTEKVELIYIRVITEIAPQGVVLLLDF